MGQGLSDVWVSALGELGWSIEGEEGFFLLVFVDGMGGV